MAVNSLERVRQRLNETGQGGFWTDIELQNWLNVGYAWQHREVFRRAKLREMRVPQKAHEHDYLKLWHRRQTTACAIGVQDYALPADFWRIDRVTIGGAPEYTADAVGFDDDNDVRFLPHLGPAPTRPKYALIPLGDAAASPPGIGSTGIRLYVSPGDRTVPRDTRQYRVYYFSDVVLLDPAASPPIYAILPDPFNDAPVAHACAMAHMKQYQFEAAQPYLAERDQILESIIEGPSPEVQRAT